MKHLVLSCLFALTAGSLFAAPSNDKVANAIVLPSANIVSKGGTNYYATADSFDQGLGYSSVWYRWTAPLTSTAAVTVTGYFDTTLVIYTKDSTGYHFVAYVNDGNATLNSTYAITDATAGTEYYFGIDGRLGRQGAFFLSIAQAGGVSDSFAGSVATQFSGTSFLAVGNNSSYTGETGEPAHGDTIRVSRKTAWVSWTAPARSRVTLTTLGSRFDTVLAVYTGDTVNNLVRLAQNDDYGSGTNSRLSQVQFVADPGKTYHFAVDGNSGTSGLFNLNMTSSSIPPGVILQPSKDLIVYQGDPATITASASATGTPAFQWQRLAADTKTWVDISEDDSNYSGAKSDTLTFYSVSLDMNRDQFRVKATDTVGTSLSAAVKLTVTEFPDVQTEVLGQVNVDLSTGGLPPRPEDGTSFAYFATGLPKGVTLDPQTGLISGTVTAKAGTYRITYGVVIAGKRSPIQFLLVIQVASFSSALSGGFEALLTSPVSPSLPTAKLSLKVAPATGAYTGTVYSLADAKSYSFRGTLVLDQDLRTAGTTASVPVVIKRGKNLSDLLLHFTLEEMDARLTATLTDSPVGESEPVILGETSIGVQLAAFTATTPAPWGASYTTRLVNPVNLGSETSVLPGGTGYATVTVAPKTGTMSVKGRLSDDTPFTASLLSSKDAEYRLMQKLYKVAGGSLSGWVRLVDRGFDGADYFVPEGTGSDLYWIKPANSKDKLYPEGFGPLALTWLMDKWTVPTTNLASLLYLNSLGEFSVSIDIGSGDSAITNPLVNTRGLPVHLKLAANNKVTVPAPDGTEESNVANDSKFAVTVNAKTGAYTGSFSLKDTVNGKVVTRKVAFSGVLVQSFETYEGGPFGQGYAVLPPLPDSTDGTITGVVDLLAGPPDSPFFE